MRVCLCVCASVCHWLVEQPVFGLNHSAFDIFIYLGFIFFLFFFDVLNIKNFVEDFFCSETMKLGILISAFALISWYGIGETMADDVGDPCVAARTGASGTCRMIEQCQQVRDEIVNFNQFPEPCGFEGNQLQIICCPNPPTEPVVQPTSNRISAISKFC